MTKTAPNPVDHDVTFMIAARKPPESRQKAA